MNARKLFSTFAGVALAVSLVAPAAWAADPAPAAAKAAAKKPALELTVKSFQEVEVVDKAGKTTKKTVPVSKIVPGDVVIYAISWKNNGSQPASGVVIDNPVPPQVTFVAGSSKSPLATDEVSVDQGKTWGALEALKVTGADGKQRAATAADVNDVRWTLAAPIKAGGTGSVGYRAIVK